MRQNAFLFLLISSAAAVFAQGQPTNTVTGRATDWPTLSTRIASPRMHVAIDLPVWELRETQGMLTDASSAEGRRGNLYRTEAYTVQAYAGQRLDISVRDAAFDSYLYLISPTGGVLAVNDDDPEFAGSRITETLPLGGSWRIEVTSFAPFGTGSYKLQVNGCPALPQ